MLCHFNEKLHFCSQTVLPPIRKENKKKTKAASTKQNENNNKSKRIKSYDYSAWDKFDVVCLILYVEYKD